MSLPKLNASLRAARQEFLVWRDDVWYWARNGGRATGLSHRTAELAALAQSRWGAHATSDLHVLYVGHPTNWEPHNVPADPGLQGVVSTFWLADAGMAETDGGALRRRDEVGPAVLERIRKEKRTRPVHIVLAYLAGSHVRPEHIRAWGDEGVVTVGFHLDDRLFFRGRRVRGIWSGPADTAKAFDLNLTNVRKSLTKYAVVGARAMFWPEGANPGLFRPLPVERTHDVAFLGGRYGPRGEVVSRLEKQGFSVLAHGPGWPGGPVTTEEVPLVFNRGRVVLGFSGIGWSMRATCLKGRDFEAPMCGAAYLTSWNPELPLVWRVGEEVETWGTEKELARKLRAMLMAPAQLEKMRSAALVRARRDHTWARRVESIARVCGHAWRAPVVDT